VHREMATVIQVSAVSKRFRKGFRYLSLREELTSWGRRLLGHKRGANGSDEFAAVDNLSFDVNRGQGLGVIGSNGAGKSTLLKLIARVTYPDRGSIVVRGRVASLIEVSAGLHPELTGRDNIFVNGAILGMRRAEILEKFDSIVSFSELGDFIDMPVKRYSSGMYVRLGFSVAVHTDPDILLVDEALSVGDVGFQVKSLDRMLAFRDRGVTVLFVSHDLPAISQMCDRVLWIEHGQRMMLGPTDEVLEGYLEAHDRKLLESQRAEDLRGRDIGSGEVVIETITTHRSDGSATDSFLYREALLLKINYRAFTEVKRPYFIVAVAHHTGTLFAASMQFDERCPKSINGRGVIEVLFKELPLLPGLYQVMGQIRRDVSTNYYNPRFLTSFLVASPLTSYGYTGTWGLSNSRNTAPVVVPYEWRFPEGKD
jgi:ABC-type polysaccharide/polyol phosphate transport system ATPase subunit